MIAPKPNNPPTTLAEDMLLAAEWLDCNEGTEGESEACRRVAEWLRKQAQKLENDKAIRAIVKQAGCSAQKARATLTRIRNDRAQTE